MNGKLRVHGHCNGLKTTLLFALMWGVIMLIWWATGGGQRTLGIYILIGLGSTFASYWFSDKLAIASMHAQEVSEQEAPVLYKIVRELSAKSAIPPTRSTIDPHSAVFIDVLRGLAALGMLITHGVDLGLRGALGADLSHASTGWRWVGRMIAIP